MGECLSSTPGTSTSLPWDFPCTGEDISEKLSEPSQSSSLYRKATHYWGFDNNLFFLAAQLCVMVWHLFLIFFLTAAEWWAWETEKGPREDIQCLLLLSTSPSGPLCFHSSVCLSEGWTEKQLHKQITAPLSCQQLLVLPGARESLAKTKYRCIEQDKIGKKPHIFSLRYSNKQFTQVMHL